ncbi:uncharacterized protein CDAR_251841 [Caerostris darwini]|uniref:Uncharacterized protein n=1 Tax=Caerostris darwini TaxID=1538125 RepID=A0AAV4U2N1_9ARAC|nr:uncharacterized protein CDAR_251841 [Caerostris darwini]
MFNKSKRTEIIKQKSNIDDIFGSIQVIFSFPSLILILLKLLFCFSILSLYLDENYLISGNIRFAIQFAIQTTDSLVILVSTLWIAGRIPIEERKFKDAFHKKMDLRMFIENDRERLELERWLFIKPDFVFNGWNILSYQRSSIFALFGTIITYTLLVGND